MGVFGLLVFMATRTLLDKKIQRKKTMKMLTPPFFYLLALLLFLPPSFPILLLFFILIALIGNADEHTRSFASPLSNQPIIAGVVMVVAFILVCATAYGSFRAYSAEYQFKKALDGLSENNGPKVYSSIVSAIQANPYNESYHMGFSQINLLIANNVATKQTLTDEDRQTITQTIQQAIEQAKIAVQLNPGKAANWENLAVIYRNIVNVAQGADAWTIAAYQKAIALDPTNPQLRLNLGGVYYSLKNMDEARLSFQQAINLKPDWANARYNLAWTYFQAKQYPQAVLEMQNVLALVPKDNPDYTQALADFEEFKKKLPPSKASQTTSTLQPTENQQPLSLPQEPEVVITPKIELPQSSSPEAQIGN